MVLVARACRQGGLRRSTDPLFRRAGLQSGTTSRTIFAVWPRPWSLGGQAGLGVAFPQTQTAMPAIYAKRLRQGYPGEVVIGVSTA